MTEDITLISGAIPTPQVSSLAAGRAHETLVQRGAFEVSATLGTLGRIGRYEILNLLGEGGMGLVYLARDPSSGDKVAIKIMKSDASDDPRAVHQFLSEARHMGRMSHPHILRVLEVIDRKEGPCYVMPYADGGNLLSHYQSRKPLPGGEILPIARQLAGALAYAHAHGVIHRDLKPGNVLLDKKGNIFLTDFGLVRTIFNDSMIDVTANHLEGTAPYMSPAVANGEAEDTRCDIYAFGAVLYELLTGKPPYTGRTPHIILEQVRKGPPPPIQKLNPSANPSLVRIAEGCMARELRDRYASMTDVVSDFNRVSKGQAPLGAHRQPFRRPHIAALLIGMLTVIGLIGFMVHHFSAPQLSATVKKNVPAANSPQSTTPSASQPSSPQPPIPYTYTIKNNAITITKYTGPGGDIVIPNKINGLPVALLGYCAFSRNDLTSVTIQDGVTVISSFAFWSCDGLTNLSIPKSVRWIAGNSFCRCSRLNMIKVEAANPTYCSTSDGVVFNKAKTKLVRYPSGRTGNYIIPPDITCIGRDAFTDSINLTTINIPSSVTNIENYAFGGCNKLKNVVIPESIISIGEGVFSDCGSLTDMTIPKSITHIGKHAFVNCGGLLRTEIPESVTRIDGNPFSKCNKLTSFVVDTANPAYCNSEDGILYDKEKTTLIGYPGGKNGGFELPGGVIRIGDNAFTGCRYLTSLTIPASVTRIDSEAFGFCDNLTAIYFNGNVPSLGNNLFENSKQVTIYYRPSTSGWGKEFGGRPTKEWMP